MENLVTAWLIRVEQFSAEVFKKRARLDDLRERHLDLHVVHQEEERLLADSSKYLSELLLERAQLGNKIMSARKNAHRQDTAPHLQPATGRRCNEDTSDGTSERLRRALDGEKAQMEAYNALADEAAAEAKKAELKMEQELDQVVAQTKSVEQEVHQTKAAVACSCAEKNSQAGEYKGLQKQLSSVVDRKEELEQNVATLKSNAAKRAQQLRKSNMESQNRELNEAQRHRDTASARLDQLRQSNAEANRHLKSLERQILNAQSAMQQLCP